ncbi:MAG: transglutaminase-like domain-containing protein [Bacteroidota bacterium]
MRLRQLADELILSSKGDQQIVYKNGDTEDIISVILKADPLNGTFTEQFAPYLRGLNDYDTCRRLWRFVRTNIRYVKDRAGHEVIKSPGKTWEDGYGDCKSMSNFIASCLKNLGIPYRYRFTSYERDREIGHVYVLAFIGRRVVVLDAVHHTFDQEVSFTYVEDYDPQGTQVYSESIGAMTQNGGKNWGWVGRIFWAWLAYQVLRHNNRA